MSLTPDLRGVTEEKLNHARLFAPGAAKARAAVKSCADEIRRRLTADVSTLRDIDDCTIRWNVAHQVELRLLADWLDRSEGGLG